MNWLVFHLISGDAFFTGVALLIVAVLTSVRASPSFRRIMALSLLLGLIAIVLTGPAHFPIT